MNELKMVVVGNSALQSDGRNVLDVRATRNNFRKIPYCIYFYYIGPARDGTDDHYVRHYYKEREFEPIRYEEIEEIIRDLALNARRPEGEQNPQPNGSNLDNLKWYRKSYLAFIIDRTDEYLSLDNPLIVDQKYTGKKNYSFFDGWAKEVDLSPGRNGSQMRTATCFINHMKTNWQGSDLGDAEDYIPSKLNILRQRGDKYYPDSGGTNMGPPMPPP